MHLATDEQTITDLGIFARKDGTGIYDLYNQTRTTGGEALLKELFQDPLSDRAEINRRSNLIEHFSTLGMDFPFDIALFDQVEKYLANVEDPKKGGAQQNVLGEKEIRQGVMAVITLLRCIRDFTVSAKVKSVAAYDRERSATEELLAHQAFAPALKEASRGRISFTAVTAYDVLFRQREYGKISALLRQMYLLDVYISIAALARERQFIFPRALEKGRCTLKLKGVYHPELKEAIGNDIMMDQLQNVIFLTGANMAGKSTFLRSVSTALYVAHIGLPVAAKSMEFSVMDGIYTTINLPDNLGMGASHFYSEVLRVKKVAAELHQGKLLFIVFDELFRGTNVKDAHEATVAVAGAFAQMKGSLFIISSHIIEAGEDLKREASVTFRYLPTQMNGHVPVYTYLLEKGITDDRHGMIIIRNEGILTILENGKRVL